MDVVLTKKESNFKEDFVDKKSVICVETGVVFKNRKQAEIEMNLNHSTIYLQMKGRQKYVYDKNGNAFHFKYVNKKQNKKDNKNKLIYCVNDNKYFLNCSEADRYYNFYSGSVSRNVRGFYKKSFDKKRNCYLVFKKVDKQLNIEKQKEKSKKINWFKKFLQSFIKKLSIITIIF